MPLRRYVRTLYVLEVYRVPVLYGDVDVTFLPCVRILLIAPLIYQYMLTVTDVDVTFLPCVQIYNGWIKDIVLYSTA